MAPNGPFLFVTALDWEAHALLRSLESLEAKSEAGLHLWRGSAGGAEVWILRSGIGPDRARRALEWATAIAAPRAIVSTGCAGALREDLRPGDFVLASEVCAEGRRPVAASPDWIERYRRAAQDAGIRAERGGILTSRSLLGSFAEKREAAQSTGCLAVEMEGAAIGEWASRDGTAFVAARAIVDSMSTTLPKGIVDAEGRPKPLRLLAALARHPTLIAKLAGLRADLRTCETSLRALHERLFRTIGMP